MLQWGTHSVHKNIERVARRRDVDTRLFDVAAAIIHVAVLYRVP